MWKAVLIAVVSIVAGMSCSPRPRSATLAEPPVALSQCQDYPEKDFLPTATANAASIRRFYEVHYQARRLKTGQIDVVFIIDRRGIVSWCRVESSTLNDPAFEDALLKRLKHWKLPTQSETDEGETLYKFRYAFIFRR